MFAYITPVKKSLRLSSEERREEILKAALRIFAERGFHGTTTRELASEADISEALLFKYFPTKEAIYNAMLASCRQSPTGEEIRRLLALKPSTTTLVLMVHHLLAKQILASPDSCNVGRLLVRSLSEDASFGRILLRHVGSSWIAKLSDCIGAAVKCGDIEQKTKSPVALAWFCHHLALSIFMLRLPEKEIVEYEMSKQDLVEQSVLFALRGVGLSETAIQKHYDPAALTMLMS